jgi:flagellar basal-body rod modification protein FlgD
MPITSVSGTNATTQQESAQLPEQTLNQSDFLKLLVAQLSSQDPMNPVSDTDFIAQMAQFSTLQETTSMQESISSLQANSLLGQTVQVQNGQGQVDSGVVSAVLFQSGSPELIVNGQSYTVAQVLSISQAQTNTETTP